MTTPLSSAPLDPTAEANIRFIFERLGRPVPPADELLSALPVAWLEFVGKWFDELANWNAETLVFMLAYENRDTTGLPLLTEGTPYVMANILVTKHFTKGHVFHPKRWPPDGALDQAFRRWRQEQGLDWRRGWGALAAPQLLVFIKQLPDDETLGTFMGWLRRKLRASIERELLGHTQDQDSYSTEPLPDEPPPDARSILELAELRADALQALQQLPPDDAVLLVHYYPDLPDGPQLAQHRQDLARRLSLTNAALRQRVNRAQTKLRELLG